MANVTRFDPFGDLTRLDPFRGLDDMFRFPRGLLRTLPEEPQIKMDVSEDDKTYRVKAELRSADTFVARIYLGSPLFGENRTLIRVPRLSSEGWC